MVFLQHFASPAILECVFFQLPVTCNFSVISSVIMFGFVIKTSNSLKIFLNSSGTLSREQHNSKESG